MDENATKALYIAISIFIVVITLGFIIAYYNTARKAGNVALLGSATVSNYEKLINSDLEETDITGLDLIEMLKKYSGKENILISDMDGSYPYRRDEAIPITDIYIASGVDEALLLANQVDIKLVQGNIPSKFLEVINAKAVLKLEKNVDPVTEEISFIVSKDSSSTHKIFKENVTTAWVWEDNPNLWEGSYENSPDVYFDIAVDPDEIYIERGMFGMMSVKLMCRSATEILEVQDIKPEDISISDGINEYTGEYSGEKSLQYGIVEIIIKYIQNKDTGRFYRTEKVENFEITLAEGILRDRLGRKNRELTVIVNEK